MTALANDVSMSLNTVIEPSAKITYEYRRIRYGRCGRYGPRVEGDSYMVQIAECRRGDQSYGW